MPSSYHALSASAGSGKTFSLVKEILKTCLKNQKPDTIRSILALTFTNKAANEMKSRILDWLKDYTSANPEKNASFLQILAELKEEGISLTPEDLRKRAQGLLDYILHHYSTLSITTIDKFNSRLIKSFSVEMGLTQNFNIEVDPTPALMEAVDQTLGKIGESEQLSKAFLDYVNYSLDHEEKINLQEELLRNAKRFNEDKAYLELQKNDKFDWKAYYQKAQEFRELSKELRNGMRTLAAEGLQVIEEAGLTPGDMPKGKNGIGFRFVNCITSIDSGKDYDMFSSNEGNAFGFLTSIPKTSKNKETLERILPALWENRQKIIHYQIELEKAKRFLKTLLPLKVNKEIQDELLSITDENELLLLSKFNILISEQIRNEPVAFIYEKVGERYRHFFFDEFQDTSKIQWENFLPLRDDALAQEKNSFTLVGDPKQSIYRFRGGAPEIMLDIIHKKEIPPPLQEITVTDLKTNYRSSRNIVEFNNELYLEISQNLPEDYRDLFGERARQMPHSQHQGRVRVNFIGDSKTKKADFFEETVETMQLDIQTIVDHGFDLSDIAILCRRTSDIALFSAALTKLQIHYKGELQFIKTISDSGLTLDLSPSVNAVMQFLQWRNQPQNKQFLVDMLFSLRKSGRIKIADFTKETLEILEAERAPEFTSYMVKHYGIQLDFNDKILNAYGLIEAIVREFLVEKSEADYLINFLDLAYNFFQNPQVTLQDFVAYWNDPDAKDDYKKIRASENTDAIKLMTIHKAKGLEFPVVFLPYVAANEKKSAAWFPVNSGELQSVNINTFDDRFELYDERIAAFNQTMRTQDLIDRLCVQYVATTRPVEQLYFYMKPTTGGYYAELYNFLEQRSEGETRFDLFEIPEEELNKAEKKKEASPNVLNADLPKHQPLSKQAQIKIATPSRSYQERNEEVRTGIFTHELLAEIQQASDLKFALESRRLNGDLTEKEVEAIEKKIGGVFKKYPAYFDGKDPVFTEKEILFNPEGSSELLRIDRLIRTKEGWIILDFKTGATDPEYEKQISTYRQALEAAGEKVLKTEIIYL